MTDDQYLIYFPDPFGLGTSKYALANAVDITFVDAPQLSSITGPVITYDVPALIDDLRRLKAKPPAQIVDIAEAIRLATGLSKADGGERKWDYWRGIKRHFSSERDWGVVHAIHNSRSGRPTGDEERRLFGALANATISLWKATTIELKDKGEYRRFFEIEVPSAQIFYVRQYLGIAINLGEIAGCLEQATNAKYSAYRAVADELGLSPTGLNYWNVSKHLSSTDVSHLAGTVEGYALRDQLRISRDVSTFARYFTELMDATRDVDVLTRLSDSTGRIFPTFHPIGTISSRILVSDPHLQELRRKYRRVIAADPQNSLIYYDYSQFEPGIMASLSGDTTLINMYNDGDVYSALSNALFGDNRYRDLCKRLFLAFSYGMTAEGIAALLSGNQSNPIERSAVELKVKEFFSRFERLAEFKSELENMLEQTGSVATLLGNRRVRAQTGPLRPKERRWAVSQAIQGNASLIFKRAIIKLAESFGANSILLPMHDAVLMQFPQDMPPDQDVQKIMLDAFREFCPLVRARVTSGTFS